MFGPLVPPGLACHGAWGTERLAAAVADETPALEETAAALRDALGIFRASRRQLRVVKSVCELVARRSARLCAAAVAGVLQHMQSGSEEPLGHVVIAVDGSVFTKFPKYR